MALEDYRWDVWHCERCHNCNWVMPWMVKSWRYAATCPSREKFIFDSYSAQGRIDIARGILEGEIEWSDKLLEVIYTCTTCGSCDVECKFYRPNIEPLEIIFALRSRCVEEGQFLPAHAVMIESMRREDRSIVSCWVPVCL